MCAGTPVNTPTHIGSYHALRDPRGNLAPTNTNTRDKLESGMRCVGISQKKFFANMYPGKSCSESCPRQHIQKSLKSVRKHLFCIITDCLASSKFCFEICTNALTREHREPGLTDWNATLWVFRVTQNKNNGVFHLGPIAL